MTTLALGEQLGRFLAGRVDRVETEKAHDKVIHRVMIAKQVFVASADFMLWMSDYHPQYCGTYAEICRACAESCERLGRGMKRCGSARNLATVASRVAAR